METIKWIIIIIWLAFFIFMIVDSPWGLGTKIFIGHPFQLIWMSIVWIIVGISLTQMFSNDPKVGGGKRRR
jgi:hypothetical protein